MSSKTLFVYNSKILYEILNEIKDYLNLEILAINDKNIGEVDFNKIENYLIISQKKQNKIKKCLVIDESPKKISKLLEKININFLKNKFVNQSELKIGKYKLDLNSRKIIFNDISLDLTEKETDLIIYIYKQKKANLKDLQKNVWKHSSDLETHTVETHIYRLRKKINEKFNDDKFIKHNKTGYSLN